MTLAAPAIDGSTAPGARTEHTVVDLFSGAGGMSCGFRRHPSFAVVGAADAEVGKPSAGAGTLGCNASYARNMGLEPLAVDLSAIAGEDLRDRLGLPDPPVGLSACAPGTRLSRVLPPNPPVGDPRHPPVG